MPIDLVYLWVDGSDTEWLKKKQKYLIESDKTYTVEATDTCRTKDNGELQISLRSVEKHMPWINKIFIVTDNQIPTWLDTTNSKIKVVFHKDFIPEEVLPTFNSSALELYLHRIPDLSEHFIYSNDDMFVNCDLSPEFFFTKDGQPIIRLQKSTCRKKADKSTYSYMVVKMQELVRKKFGKFYNLEPHHNFDAYTKTLCEKCEDEFKNEYKTRELNRFRVDEDTHRSLISFYALATNQAKLKIIPRTDFHLPCGTKLFNKLSGRYRIDSKYLGIEKNLLAKRFDYVNPKLFCLNDNDKATETDRINAGKFLTSLFPIQSSFEKSDSPLISIIVPVYNIEKYLPKCLDSLLYQTLKNIEIICINDGSTDNSLKILEEYAARDKRIKVINQPNQGVSFARNNGINIAKGKYITFVDGDDWLELDACKRIYTQIENDNSDVILYGHYDVFGNKKKPYKLSKDCKKTLLKYDDINSYVKEIIYVPVIACGKLYKGDFILNNNLEFPIGIKQSEDHIFWYNVLSFKPQLSILDKSYYNYRNIRCGSSMENLDIAISQYNEAESILRQTNLYKSASKGTKMLLDDRNLNFFCWMWMKHKDKREDLIPIIEQRIKGLPNYRNCKLMKKRLRKYKLKHIFSKKVISMDKPIKDKISVIIPTIQSNIDLLKGLIENFENDNAIGEIIIINNKNKKLYFENYSKLRIYNAKKNLFVNKSWNIGVEKSSCEYFALINDDLILPENFCTNVLKNMSEDKGLVGLDLNYICDIDSTELDSADKLYLTPTDKREIGYGSAMFGHISSYYLIPDNLKIFCGDDYLFMQNIKNGKRNYKISGCNIKHCHQLSSNNLKFQRIKYKDVLNYSKIDKNFTIPPSCRYNALEHIIGITKGYEKSIRYKYLILFGHYIKIGICK